MRFNVPFLRKQSGTSDTSVGPVKAAEVKTERTDGKVELKEKDAFAALGFSWSTTKKWYIISVIFAIQVSMNLNASLYSNGVKGIQEHYGVSAQAARVGQAVFLICYAFGCELWAPWSEEIGRRPVLQTSLFLVNVWQVLAALAPNFGSLIVARALGGLSSAGGSVTLAMVADMWKPADQQFALAYVVFSSVGGSVVGPVVGGFVQQYLSLKWIFWVQLIFGGVVQAVHLLTVPETRVTILLDREAKRLRESGSDPNIYGPNELRGSLWQRMTLKEVVTIWTRPFVMFIFEPIVLFLSLLSGFSDALIFTFLDAFQPVYEQYGFTPSQEGLAFIPLIVGYFIAWFSFFPFFIRDKKFMAKNGVKALRPERRLFWLLFVVPLEPIGLFGFAWTSLGPSYGIPWIAPMIMSALVGIANYAIYMATIDYMVAAYGSHYSASATGGNGFARDGLAGIAAMYSGPFYTHFKTYTLEYPTTILGGIGVAVAIPVYIFYVYGPQIRARSPYAQTLVEADEDDSDQSGDAEKSGATGVERRSQQGVQ